MRAFLILASVLTLARAGEIGKVHFQTFITEPKIGVPEEGADSSTLLVLKITNLERKPILFSKYNTPEIQIRDAAGNDLRVVKYHDSIIPLNSGQDFASVDPDDSLYLDVKCHLQWVRDELWLRGRNPNGEYWYVVVSPGMYLVSLRYRVDESVAKKRPVGGVAKNIAKFFPPVPDVPLWMGDALSSNSVSLEIVGRR